MLRSTHYLVVLQSSNPAIECTIPGFANKTEAITYARGKLETDEYQSTWVIRVDQRGIRHKVWADSIRRQEQDHYV